MTSAVVPLPNVSCCVNIVGEEDVDLIIDLLISVLDNGYGTSNVYPP